MDEQAAIELACARLEERRLRTIVEEEMYHAIARGESSTPGDLPSWPEYSAAFNKLFGLEKELGIR